MTDPMPATDTAALRALLDAATPAPWTVQYVEPHEMWIVYDNDAEKVAEVFDKEIGLTITALRNQGTALLDELAAARAEAEQAQAALAELKRLIADVQDAVPGDSYLEYLGEAGLRLLRFGATSAAAPQADEPNFADDVTEFVEQHGYMLTDWQKRYLRAQFEEQGAEYRRRNVAVPGDGEQAALRFCGNPYIGNEGEFTCDRFAGHDRHHWNLLAEFGWGDGEQAATTSHARTTHGHVCCAYAIDGKPPRVIAKCGGPLICTLCGEDKARIHAASAVPVTAAGEDVTA